MTQPGGFLDIERHQGRKDQNRENGARLARTTATYQGVGVGSNVVRKAYDFGVTFIEEPIFTYGYVLDDSSPDLDENNFPMGFAMTYSWVYDSHDFYTGAYVGLFSMTSGGYPWDNIRDPRYKLNFHLVWEGVAYKDVLRGVSASLVDY